MAGTFKYAKPSEVRDKVKLWNKKIANLRPLLFKLQNLRNDLIAHLSANVILDPQEMKKTIGVTFDEIELILNVAKDLVKEALDAYANSMYVDEL